jgi:hypothetical protein
MFELAMVLSVGGVVVFGPYEGLARCAEMGRQIMQEDGGRSKPVYGAAACYVWGTTVKAQRQRGSQSSNS